MNSCPKSMRYIFDNTITKIRITNISVEIKTVRKGYNTLVARTTLLALVNYIESCEIRPY